MKIYLKGTNTKGKKVKEEIDYDGTKPVLSKHEYKKVAWRIKNA